MFKQHLEMIGRNETPAKKAKFWQSYIRSLKGSDDIRAHDAPKSRPTYRSEVSPTFRSIYDEPATASERITGVGYRYLPVHRDTYGYSPRAIYSHHYNRPTSSYENKRYDADKAWAEHTERMKEIERRYPSRYGLYLKDKPSAAVVPLEYEPEDKPIRSGPNDRNARGTSVPPLNAPALFAPSVQAPQPTRGQRATSLAPLDSFFSEYDRYEPNKTILSPTPVKSGKWGTRYSEVAFDSEGKAISRPGFEAYNSLKNNLLNPRPNQPITAFTRDPFWYDLGDLKPFTARIPSNHLPSHLRDSFLSPVKPSISWEKHPVRILDDEFFF